MNIRHVFGNAFIIMVVLMTVYVVSQVNSADSFVDVGRCGVGLPSCSGEHVRCINGYCKSDQPPRFPTISDLQMVPASSY